jgi:hypothetical protein
MYFESTPYALPVLFGAAILLPTASYAWRRRTTVGAVPIALLLLAQAEWMIAASLEAFGANLATTVAMGKLAFVGVNLMAPLLLVAALTLSNQSGLLNTRRLVALGTIPALGLVLVFTNDSHHLFWESAEVDPLAPYVTWIPTHGPAF